MQELISYLVENADVLDKVKAGTASLINVTSTELQAILDVFDSSSGLSKRAGYWD
jgi:competence protein ComX